MSRCVNLDIKFEISPNAQTDASFTDSIISINCIYKYIIYNSYFIVLALSSKQNILFFLKVDYDLISLFNFS